MDDKKETRVTNEITNEIEDDEVQEVTRDMQRSYSLDPESLRELYDRVSFGG